MRRSCLHKFSPFGSIHPHLYPHLCLPHKYSRHGSIHTLIPGSTPESSLVSPASPAIAMQLAQSTLSSLTSSHPHLHPHMYSYSLHPVSNGPYTRSCSLHSVRWFPSTFHTFLLYILFFHTPSCAYRSPLTGSHTHVFSLSILFQFYFGTFPSRHIRVSPSC
jgi:hypothetical protein